ncbi:MAG: M55 family metallopeptidase [Actinomycetes bacterium]|jgi:D-amino peptidase|nr:M55 family metallopeptidase [Actinomycetes bacterium]
MKVYISVDIEGVAGVTAWPETNKGQDDYAQAARLMTAEALAAVQGVTDAGAREVYVKDAHDTARNMDPAAFPREVQLVRGWTRDPLQMIGGIDDSFDAVLFVGYHAAAGNVGNPLAHTMTSERARGARLNGRPLSEFYLHALAAEAIYGVPSVFVSGDAALCEEASGQVAGIVTVPVKHALGAATVSIAPELARERIRAGVADGLQRVLDDRASCHPAIPESFELCITRCEHASARQLSYYPGAELLDDGYTVRFVTGDAFEMVRAMLFIGS